MLADLWPLYGLTIATGGLRLRLPTEGELVTLAELAARGVHAAGERPFLTPWTDGSPTDRARSVLRDHWGCLASWRVDAWQLNLAVLHNGAPLGVVTVRARDFPVVREVTTSAWLGIDHQGHGHGTRARLGLLSLAFDHLGANAARSEVFQDNHASQAVSRRLGYAHDGISVDARGNEAVVSDRLRLTRERWLQQPRPEVSVDAFSACRSLFGL